MNASVQQNTKLDVVIWAIVVLLIGAGVVANVYFVAVPWSIRLIGWLVLACVVGLIAFQTSYGRKTWSFLRECRIEISKVYWPTRQETLQTTLMVIAMVVIVALLLWGIDSILLWAIAILTGQRG